MTRPIRNSAKAIIIQDGKLLLTHNLDQSGEYFLLPGGGQDKNELIADALHRECLEEIGAEIEIGDIRYIREYIGKNHEFTWWDRDLHQVEFMFICSLKSGGCDIYSKGGHCVDERQVGVKWVAISELSKIPLYPRKL
jgi:8-oxo-dGTP diphosphatase